MHLNFKQLSFAFIFCLAGSTLSAQLKRSRYEIGFSAGSFIYQGDLSPSVIGSFKTPGIGFGINGSRKLTSALSVKADVHFGNVRGDDGSYSHPAWRQQRNFNFRARVTEVTGSVLYAPFESDQKLSPYLFAGIGYALLHITRDYSAYNPEYFAGQGLTGRLNQDLSFALPSSLPIIPFGIGFRYPLTTAVALNAEAGYRYIRTDLLDGFSQSGNPKKNDHYYHFSFGLNYAFARNNNLRCPVVKF